MEEKDLSQELEKIKQELEELKKKLSETEGRSIKDLPAETLSKIADVGKDIVKAATDIGEKALRVVKSSIEGAVEGAKRAIKDENKQE
ncbi:MAG: hypothetical protein ABDH18_03950 [Aquificaceae bacterium]